MGTLRSSINLSGLIVNGVLLGVPIFDETTSMYKWDDESFPSGIIDALGNIENDDDY